MSSTSTSPAEASSTSAPCGTWTFDIPVSQPACGMAFGGNHTDVLSACCGDADVVSYRNDCGVYCLAVDQTVDDLTSCLYDHGAPWGDVFCSAAGNATATDTGATPAATASASVVASAGSSSSDADDDNDGDDSNDSGDSTSGGDAPDGSEGAAPGLKPEFASAKAGLVIGALLFSATAFGAFQL